MTTWIGTLPTWVAGEDILAADLDTMTDALAALTDVWTTYTPTWSSTGTQPAIGNGTVAGDYFQAGKTVVARIRIVMGSTTTFGTGQYFVTLPVAGVVASIAGACYMLDFGTANKSATCLITSALTTIAAVQNTADFGATTPHTWANGDRFDASIVYEVA